MTQVRSLGQDDPLEAAMATHSSILACRIPWTEEPGGLQSMQLQRVTHNWSDWAHTITHGMIQWMKKKKSNKDVFINIGLCHNCIEIKCFKEYLHKWTMINSGERNGLKETELKWSLSFLYYTHLYFVYNKNIFTYYILVKSSSINPWNLCTEWEIQESTGAFL